MALVYRLSAAFDFIDKRQIIRRGAFLWMLWLTGKTMAWTMDYAWHVAGMSGGEIAMVIAAVWVPMTALQGALFKFYDQAQVAGGSEQSAAQRRAE